ncbi:hypothetical protein GDO81_006214 [Engystomops pustulosus]|uniref:Myosin motor domain-containing protein n=1 Tax=Engystomops pustulosus TaxID=76066 RepID=A0AAV7CYD7_ENGPU|nr:hypothetical protein GDO81_006214 [Engystomops pustulosus]
MRALHTSFTDVLFWETNVNQMDLRKKHLEEVNESFDEALKSLLTEEECLHLYDDLTKVNPVTPEIVLKCLQARYTAGIFYTNAGCTVVGVNPFQSVDKLYCLEIMKAYHATNHLQDCEPHIFTTGEQAYRNIQKQIFPVDQSIIVTGESGSGKVIDIMTKPYYRLLVWIIGGKQEGVFPLRHVNVGKGGGKLGPHRAPST